MSEREQQFVQLTTEQFQALLAAVKVPKDEQLELLKVQADLQAEANRRALRPENATAPAIGVFHRADGSPKGSLKCPMTWAYTKVDEDTLKPEELDLLNQLSPGEYVCNRPDGTKFNVQVEVDHNRATGQINRLDVVFATRGQQRHNLPSMVAMCREMIAQAAKPTAPVA